MEKALEDSFKSFTAELLQHAKLLDDREKELAHAKAAYEKENKPTLEAPSDVLTLNEGGICMLVLRRTLTMVEGSMLGARFSGRWDDSLDKDKDGNFFIDQPFAQFEHMINHLRALQTETPLGPPVTPPFEHNRDAKENKMRLDFIRMVEYYGLTFALYPLEFKHLKGDPKDDVDLVCRPGIYNIDSREIVTVALSPTTSHTREIGAFEVTLGTFSYARIGWRCLQNGRMVLLDCGNNTITWVPDETVAGTVRDLTIAEGTVLRFESTGNKWFVDGRLVAFCDNTASNVIMMKDLQQMFGAPGVACIELKGQCSISVELSH